MFLQNYHPPIRYISNIDIFYNIFFSQNNCHLFNNNLLTCLYEINNNKIINSVVCTCVHLKINSTFKNSESETISLIKQFVVPSIIYIECTYACVCVVDQKKFLPSLKGNKGGVKKVLGTGCNLSSWTSGPRPFPNCSMSHSPRYPKRRWYVSAARGPSSGLNSMRIGPWSVPPKYRKRRRLVMPLLVHSRSWNWLGQNFLAKIESRFPNNVCGHVRNEGDRSIVLAFRVNVRSLQHPLVYIIKIVLN